MKWLVSIPFLIPALGEERWPLFYGEVASFIGIGLILWNLKEKIKWQPITIVLICLTIYFLIVQSPYVVSRVILSLCYIGSGIILISISKVSNTSISKLLNSILLSSIILALFGIIQYFHLSFPMSIEMSAKSYEGMVSIVGQRNLLANYLFCGVISCVALKKEYTNWVLWLVLCLLGVCLILTGSRTVYLYLVWLIVWKGIDQLTVFSCKRIIVTSLVSTAILLLLILLPSVVERAETISNLMQNPRVILFQNAMEMFLRNPIFGQGIGEFSYGMYLNSSTSSLPFIERNSHNLFSSVLAESGIVGFLILASFTFIWWKRRIKESEELKPIWGIIGVQLIHSMLEFPLWHMQWLALFCICVGLTMNQNFERK